ncbi:N-acetylmuramoyl-L-alanine amidase [Streptomyces sp. SID1328]|nr:peptidoglycan recognition family protein [Streptomyces sp. SID1328]MYV43999.1 N-acetylmuramoyl-L-alanine amidase [Streptomyces sp. SID1328]
MGGSALPRTVRHLYRTACVIAAAALITPLLGSWPLGGPHDRGSAIRLQRAFSDAAAEFRVPRSVLLGVSYMESRWDAHAGAPSVIGGYGPMHLTDMHAALAGAPGGAVDRAAPGRSASSADPPASQGALTAKKGPSRQLATLERAAGLLRVPSVRLRTDAVENIRGGAALLAATQRELGRPLGADPAEWWGAVARFSGSTDSVTAATYADNVFEVIRKGAQRTTDTGQRVTLAASPGVRPGAREREAVPPHEASAPGNSPDANAKSGAGTGVECPATLACAWLPAPRVLYGDDRYGNHDVADRPKDQKIEYVVIHDTEDTQNTMFQTVQTPSEASWHYTISSGDGRVTQHLRTKDIGWHSGNQDVNARSIGVEHEGFLAQPDTWYTEQMYQSSARLVSYLAKKYAIPLDRQHIIGHEDVPGPTTASIPAMHEDPGPYWDWRHYFDLLGAPLRATAGPNSELVTVLPDFVTNRPTYTGCTGEAKLCAPHGSSAVRLYTEPSESAPLVQDMGKRPDGEDSTIGVYDMTSRVSTGQTYAVAQRRGDWTAIWYLGQKAWFRNPSAHPTAVGSVGRMVTPKPGLSDIPVYGRANPEELAYPDGTAVHPDSPLPYKFLAGQRYATPGTVRGEHFEPSDVDSASPGRFVKGQALYYEIQFGHRLAYVRADDVDVVRATA